METIYLPAAAVAVFAVHGAGLDGQEIDAERAEINAALYASIEIDGVREAVSLEIDLDRRMARLGNGNHRATMAAHIDPLMVIPVNVKVLTGLKRPLGGAKPYTF